MRHELTLTHNRITIFRKRLAAAIGGIWLLQIEDHFSYRLFANPTHW